MITESIIHPFPPLYNENSKTLIFGSFPSVKSREKDYTDYYRTMVYRSKDEMEAVLGQLSNNSFLKALKKYTAVFIDEVKNLFSKM